MNHRSALLFVSIVACALFMCGCAASPNLVSIQVTPGSANIVNANGTVQFTAMGTYSHGKHPSETRDITAQVTWASSNSGTATISAAGVATAVNDGTTSITATMDGSNGLVTASSTLDVNINSAGTGGGVTPGTRDLTGITLIPANQTINGPGNSAQFTALGTFSAAPTTQVLTNVIWQSTNSSVATINDSGLATAVACSTGSCISTITATATAQSGATIIGTGQLTVTPGTSSSTRDLTAITLIPGSQTITGSGSVQFMALGTFSAAPTTTLLTNVTWQSSSTSIATINASGVATAGVCSTSSCVTTISATATAPISGAAILGTAQLTFNPLPSPPVRDLTSVTLIPSSGTITGLGNTAQFIALGVFNTSPTTQIMTNQVTWSSSNSSVAAVSSSGLVTAGSCPTSSCSAIITASTTGPSGAEIVGTAPLSVNVAQPPPPSGDLIGLNLIPVTQSLTTIGETAQFIAIGTFNAAPITRDWSANVIWKSSDVDVATIDSNGLATGVGAGNTTITALGTSTSGNTIVASATLSEDGSGVGAPLLMLLSFGGGAGNVISSPSGINCGTAGSACAASFALGSTVTLTATPSGTSTFSSWSNCAPVSGTPNQCTIIMGGNQVVDVTFN